MAEALRTKPLPETTVGSGAATVAPAAEASRISLRAGEEAIEALSAALDVDLPTRPKTSNNRNGRIAMWIGPDEWTVIDQKGSDLMGLLSNVDVLHSAVDISHRNTAILVNGPAAADAISGACPQDVSLSAFPVGAASRTVLGKIEIVLYRASETSFRVECWRSFAPYALQMLHESALDAAN